MKKIVLLLLMMVQVILAYEIRLSPPKNFYIQDKGLYTSLKGSSEIINDEFKEYLRNGIMIHFTYFIDIMKEQFFWYEMVERQNIQKSLHYDLWKKKYIVTEYTPKKSIIEYKSLDDATGHFLNINDVFLFKIDQLNAKESYVFKTRVTAKVTQLKSYFHIIFSLLSVFKYKTTYLISQEFTSEELLLSPLRLN